VAFIGIWVSIWNFMEYNKASMTFKISYGSEDGLCNLGDF